MILDTMLHTTMSGWVEGNNGQHLPFGQGQLLWSDGDTWTRDEEVAILASQPDSQPTGQSIS